MHPIWKDYYVRLRDEQSEATSVEFAIEFSGEIIYQGRAYRRPNESVLRVKVNDICADYIKTPALLTEQGFSPVHYDSFLFYDVSEGWEEVDHMDFFNDWSYEEYPYHNILAIPINGRVCNRMLLPVSVTINPSEELEVECIEILPDGNEFIRVINVAGAGVSGGLYMVDLSEVKAGMELYATMVSSGTDDIPEVIPYKCVDSCARYALYYINARGGWDALLMEGNHSESDSLVRKNRSVEYDNRDQINRGRKNYAVEITKKMTLHTSWMSDEESSRMHHLLNSPEVYLYDMDEKKFIPVLLTNTTTEYKTYKGNGGKLVNYAIEVEFANERQRR